MHAENETNVTKFCSLLNFEMVLRGFCFIFEHGYVGQADILDMSFYVLCVWLASQIHTA